MGGHFADDMGFMGIAMNTGISSPAILERGAGGDIVLDEECRLAAEASGRPLPRL